MDTIANSEFDKLEEDYDELVVQNGKRFRVLHLKYKDGKPAVKVEGVLSFGLELMDIAIPRGMRLSNS